MSLKIKAILFSYYHQYIFNKISALRASILDLKKILK